MRISAFQHAAGEGPGTIASWARERGHVLTVHYLYRGESPPTLSDFDLLVILGGDMNVYQYRDYPWLVTERELVSAALLAGQRVFGICLGAQMIADVLGSRVAQNPEREIGWFPITLTEEARSWLPSLPLTSTVLHWHNDTFSLPLKAKRLGQSAACPEQGFFIEQKCLGLQFHLEVEPSMFTGSTDTRPLSEYVQLPEQIVAQAGVHAEENCALMYQLLDRFCEGLT